MAIRPDPRSHGHCHLPEDAVVRRTMSRASHYCQAQRISGFRQDSEWPTNPVYERSGAREVRPVMADAVTRAGGRSRVRGGRQSRTRSPQGIPHRGRNQAIDLVRVITTEFHPNQGVEITAIACCATIACRACVGWMPSQKAYVSGFAHEKGGRSGVTQASVTFTNP